MTKISLIDNCKISPAVVSFKDIPVGTAFLGKTNNLSSQDLRIKVSRDSYINLSERHACAWTPLNGAFFADYEEVDLEIKVIHKS